MILRGVQFARPALDKADIDAIKSRASRSGRSYGGVPLREDHGGGRGRGGQINYADSRPNPFAAHINPDFIPPALIGGHQGVPQPPSVGSWNLPLMGSENLQRGPPPPPSSYARPTYGYPPSPSQSVNYDHSLPSSSASNSAYNGYIKNVYRDQLSPNTNDYPPPSNHRYPRHSDRNNR